MSQAVRPTSGWWVQGAQRAMHPGQSPCKSCLSRLDRPDSPGYTAPPSRQAVEQAFETLPEASVRERVKRDPGASPAPGSSAFRGRRKPIRLEVLFWFRGREAAGNGKKHADSQSAD